MQVLGSVARALDFKLTTKWRELPESAREAVLYGTGTHAIPLRFEDGRTSYERSEEHTSELQSLMRISYAVFCLNKKNKTNHTNDIRPTSSINTIHTDE